MQEVHNQSLCLPLTTVYSRVFFQNVDAVDQSAIFRISSISTEAFAAAQVEAPRAECALKIEMSTAASASMLGRGCMVGQTNLSPLVNRSKDGFAAKGEQAGVGCRGETSPF